MNRDDLLYLAGVLDGEGHFSYSRSVNKGNGGAIYVYYYPAMLITNADIEHLIMIRRLIGHGRINVRKQSHTYSYSLFSNNVVMFAKLVLPFMRRRYQILRMNLIAQYEEGNHGGNESLYLAMRNVTKQLGGSTLFIEHEKSLGHSI